MMSFCRSVFPGDETRPNPGAMGCLAAYKEKIARYPATLDTLMALFKGINEKTKNYPDVNLSGLRGYICELMADKQKKYFFGTLLPFLIDLALSYPKDEIKILRASTKEGVSGKLCTINMGAIHEDRKLTFKYPFFLCYFEKNLAKIHEGSVSFMRFFNSPQGDLFWKDSKLPLCPLKGIEDTLPEYVKVDFANKFIGGGVLTRGSVQEEIMFLEHPELIASRLFMEEQGPGDCIMFSGPEQYSSHTGYARETAFNSLVEDKTPLSGDGKEFQKIILAINATNYSKDKFSQFRPKEILHEINKAYSGFKEASARFGGKVATGNWGCGAFKGNIQLKILIQVIAASQAGCKELLYCTNDVGVCECAVEIVEKLRDMKYSVGSLYGLLLHCLEKGVRVRNSDDVRVMEMIKVCAGLE